MTVGNVLFVDLSISRLDVVVQGAKLARGLLVGQFESSKQANLFTKMAPEDPDEIGRSANIPPAIEI